MGLIRSRWVVVIVSSPCMVVDARGQVGCHCHHCCRCVELPLCCTFSGCSLSQRQFGRCSLTPPSWCDGSLAITPPKPTEDDVHDEVVVLVGCVSGVVVALLSADTVVRCPCCAIVGFEGLNDDEVEVADVACRTDGVEALTS